MSITEIIRSEIVRVNSEDKEIVTNEYEEVGCGGLIFGGGSCGANTKSTR